MCVLKSVFFFLKKRFVSHDGKSVVLFSTEELQQCITLLCASVFVISDLPRLGLRQQLFHLCFLSRHSQQIQDST